MKRVILLTVVISLLLSLSACSLSTSNSTDHVTFYYCRDEYAFGTTAGVMDSEQRYVSTHAEDLEYLLSLYFVGPMDEDLISLFPDQTRLLSVESQNHHLLVTISDAAGIMDDSQFTLACACMTMTCLELADYETVEIICGERTVTMGRENLLLYDEIVTEQPTTEEPQ